MIKNKEKLKIKIDDFFDLEETFECGQCFRWGREGSFYRAVVNKKDILVYFDSGTLILEGEKIQVDEQFFMRYFDSYTEYSKIKEVILNIDPIFEKAIKFCPGIRLLKQDPWETLCSFIISQNNNIPRIKGIISRFCENFGEQVSENGFSFPEAEKIASLTENDLQVIKSGFRAGYIIDAARKVSSGEINFKKLSNMNISDAKAELMKIRGVGPKVADCTLLYGFHRLEAFPVDIWMKRVLEKYFPGKEPEFFGEYRGLAQQYLFHYERMSRRKN